MKREAKIVLLVGVSIVVIGVVDRNVGEEVNLLQRTMSADLVVCH